jgi:hypothetical protein
MQRAAHAPLGGFLLQSWSLLATIEAVLQITFLLQQLCPGEASLARLAFSIALYVFLSYNNPAKRYAPP